MPFIINKTRAQIKCRTRKGYRQILFCSLHSKPKVLKNCQILAKFLQLHSSLRYKQTNSCYCWIYNINEENILLELVGKERETTLQY